MRLLEDTERKMSLKIFDQWKGWAKKVKSQLYALYLAYKDPRVPWYAKVFGALVLAYALSPLDLILKQSSTGMPVGECSAIFWYSWNEWKTEYQDMAYTEQNTTWCGYQNIVVKS